MNGQWQLAFIIVTALIVTVVISSAFYFSNSSTSLGNNITVSKDGDITTPGVITASNISPTNKTDIENLQSSVSTLSGEVSTLSGEVGGFNGRITSLETKTDQITIDGNNTVFTQNVEILGDLNVMGTVTANNTVIDVFEYLEVNQNPTDTVTPGLKIVQSSPFNGPPIVITSPGGTTVFEVQNNGSVVASNLSGVNTGDQLTFSSIGGISASSTASTVNFVGTGAVNITPNQGSGTVTFDVDLSTIEGEVGTLQSEVSALQTNVGTLTTTTNTLSGTVSTLSNDVTILQSDVATLDTTTTTLSGTVSTLSGTVSTLSGTVSTLSNEVSTLNGEVGTIGSSVSTLEGTVNNLSGQVATLTGEVGTIGSSVSTLTGDVSTLTGDVSTLTGDVSTLTGDVSTLNGKTQYLSSNSTSSTFSKDLTVQGNLYIQGSTTTNDSIVNVYDGYVQIIQNPADGTTPALDIIQSQTNTGPIMSVKDGDTNTIFSINQNADVSTDGSITSKGNLIINSPSIFEVNATNGNLTTSGTIGGSNFTGSVSGTNTGDQDVFNQFTVQGDSVVIAESTTTNVTFIPGSGIGIVADNAAKTLTFTSTNADIFDPTTKTYSVQDGVWNTPGIDVGISTLQGNPGNVIPMDISSNGFCLFKDPNNTLPYVYIYTISTNSWSFITTVGNRPNNILAKAFGNFIVVGCRGNDGVSTLDLYNYTSGNAVFVSNIEISSSIAGYTGIDFSNNYLTYAYTNSSTSVSSIVLKQFNAGAFISVGIVIPLPVILDANCSIQICPNPSGVLVLPNSTSKVMYFISSSPFTSITQSIFFTDNTPVGWTYTQDMSFAVDNSYFYLLNPGVSSNRGAIAVFNWNGSSWVRVVNYVLTNANVNDYFGSGTGQGTFGNEVSFFNLTNSILNICSYSSNKVLQYSVTKSPSLSFTYIGVTTPQFSGAAQGFFSFSSVGDYLSYFPYLGTGVKNVQIFNSLSSTSINYQTTTENIEFSGRVLMDGDFVALPTNTSSAIDTIISTGEDINGMSYVDSSTGATLTRFNGQWNSTRGNNTGDQLTFTSIGGVSASTTSTSLSVNSSGSITVTPNNGTKTLSLDVSSSITNPIQNQSATSGNTNFSGTLNTTGNLTVATNKAIIDATSGNATFTGVVSGSNVTATNSTDITALQGKTQNISAGTGTTSFTGAVAVGTSSAPSTGAALDMGNATSSLIVPKGTTGEQPTPVAGMIRYNTTTSSFEGASGAGPSWTSLGGGFSPLITSPTVGDLLFYDGTNWINGYYIKAPTVQFATSERTISFTGSMQTPFNLTATGSQFRAYNDAGLTSLAYDTGVLNGVYSFNFNGFLTNGNSYYFIGRYISNGVVNASSQWSPALNYTIPALFLPIGVYSNTENTPPSSSDTFSGGIIIGGSTTTTQTQRLNIINGIDTSNQMVTSFGINIVLDYGTTISFTSSSQLGQLITAGYDKLPLNDYSAFQYSNTMPLRYWNGTNWITFYTTTTYSVGTNNSQTQNFSFTPFSARYIAISRNPNGYSGVSKLIIPN